MNKHFAVVNKDQLLLKGTPDYHPLQNINAGVQSSIERKFCHFMGVWEHALH